MAPPPPLVTHSDHEIPFSSDQRNAALATLHTQIVDLAIVGGGVVGAGIARDAALRGLSVCLLEKDDFASGTSSRSSRLIHGGLRYLEQGHIALVFEALRERHILSRIAPHLCRPLPFLFPLYRDGRLRPWKIKLGLWVYDLLALFRNTHRFTYLSDQKVHDQEAALRTENLLGAAIYYDAFTHDARLTLENIKSAVRQGATCLNYATVVACSLHPTLDKEKKLWTLTFRDEVSDQLTTVHSRSVINAVGPWLDHLITQSHPPAVSYLRLTKGVHAVVSRQRLPLHHAIVLLSPYDGRVMFAIPWQHHVILGTTDTDFSHSPDTVYATETDVTYILKTANHYFPQVQLTPADVISTWAGLRPLIQSPSKHPSQVSREDLIIDHGNHHWSMVGGKLTTYRHMAERILNRVIAKRFRHQKLKACTTHHHQLTTNLAKPHPLPSCPANMTHDVYHHLTTTYDPHQAQTLIRWIEKDPSLLTPLQDPYPYVLAEAQYAIQAECALNLCDLFMRRIPLFHADTHHGLPGIEKHQTWLIQTWGCSESEFQSKLHKYQDTIALNERFRKQEAS